MKTDKLGVAFIISNKESDPGRDFFEKMCSKSIKYVKDHLNLPVALLSYASKENVKADIYIDAHKYFDKNTDREGLIIAELLKTYICDWSPFDKTLYLDCDAFVVSNKAIDYLDILNHGFNLSVATCVTMGWKDSIAGTSVKREIFGDIPRCFPYWNFGVFGCKKDSSQLMKLIRKHFEGYMNLGYHTFMSGGACPHAQPALVKAAFELSPDHRIFTMPARYNCHFALSGGFVFSGSPVILHCWKDMRKMMLS